MTRDDVLVLLAAVFFAVVYIVLFCSAAGVA